MNKFAKEIIPINLEEELKNSYLDYAMSVIIGRALPDVRDGLKPVHRRVLYAMRELNNDWNKPYKKSARVVGDVIGKYHPHGDTAVYDTIVRMAQTFSLRYILIDGQGNFGSVDGDSAAAMRYTEIRMSQITHELLSDLDKETVNFLPNYDETDHIPEVLPTKIPNLLINGSSGIAVGMATNIPPHNLIEVINGCIAYIKNENINVEELMEYISGPDFPTSGIINGKDGIKEAYRTGRGKIYIRSKEYIEIDEKTGKERIIINEIPYQVNKSRLIEKIAELVKDKRIDGISALRDESDKDGMRIVIEIKKDSIGEIVLNNLYSLTQLQVSFGINMVALYQGQPKIMNLQEIIKYFVDHRKEVVMRRTNFELSKARDRLHILEGMIIALFNIDKLIKLIRMTSPLSALINNIISFGWEIDFSTIIESQQKSIFRPDWLESKFGIHNKKYYFSIPQIKAILDLKLQKLTSIENKKLCDERTILFDQINIMIDILQNHSSLMAVIYKELKIIREQFGDKRKTTINDSKANINIEDLIQQEEVVVTLSNQGYVKYQPISDYEAQRRGGKGKSAARIKSEDFIKLLLIANTHDTILCFSSRGRLYWMKVHQLIEASRISRGKPIINLLPLANNERITVLLPVHNYEKNLNIFMATASGTVKKTALQEFKNPRVGGIIAVNLREEDELIGVALTNGNDEVMLFSSAGKVVRFSENSVRAIGRNASGVKGIKLAKNDRVVSLIIPKKNNNILTVTQNGYGKCTDNVQYPTKSRATQGVISIKVTKRNGPVVGAIQVTNKDQIMIITDTGTLVRIRVAEVNVIGRNTHGVTLIRTKTNEKVVGLQRVAELLVE